MEQKAILQYHTTKQRPTFKQWLLGEKLASLGYKHSY